MAGWGWSAGGRDAPEIPTGAITGRVVGLGATVSASQPDGERGSTHYGITEFLVLADGSRVVLSTERGFSIGPLLQLGTDGHVRRAARTEPQDPERLRETVLNVVGPDEGEPPGLEPWQRLAQIAQLRGSTVTAQELAELPYTVELPDGRELPA